MTVRIIDTPVQLFINGEPVPGVERLTWEDTGDHDHDLVLAGGTTRNPAAPAPEPPTLDDLRRMRDMLREQGVPPGPSGTYQLLPLPARERSPYGARRLRRLRRQGVL